MIWFFVCVSVALSAFGQSNVAVDSSTLAGKFLVGYQGWHACQGDGSVMNKYVHWGHLDNARPAANDTIHDIWPDLSEFAPDELFPTDLILGNGQPAKAYSCYKSNTVVRHFRWMKENNIDGVMLQRFIKDIKLTASFAELRNKNLVNVRLGAETHGRVFCVMYDMSNDNPAAFVNNLKTDWAELTSTYQITNSARYIRHNGKPVVGLWGLGFNHVGATPEQALEIIDWFKTNGCTVVGGVSTYWRTLDPTGDAHTNSAWAAVYRSFDVISPWSVGRYGEAQVNNAKNFNFIPDLAYCTTNNMDYMPVVWPGYSSHNLNNATALNGFPRNGGKFYWKQIHAAISTGCSMMYGGMFDEIEEATAIFKTAPTMATTPAVSPTNQFQFFALDVDGYSLPSDWYLRLTDQAGKMLRGELFLTDTIPITTSNGLTMISPNGGELWIAGTTQTVAWSSTGIVNNLNIDLSTDGGASWSRLASGLANTGSELLPVPYFASTNCRVRIVAADGAPAVSSQASFAIAINSNAANFNFHLEPRWSLAPGSRPYINVSGASVPLQRSIAFNSLSNQLYVVNRTGPTTGSSISVLDGDTGADLHALNTTGISGGSIILLAIGCADDGAIYAGNMSTSSGNTTSTYKLYRWANSHSNTAPVLIHTLTTPPERVAGSHTNTFRFGDTLDVRGAGTNTQIIIDEYFQGTNATVFRPSGPILNSPWISTRFTGAYGKGTIGRSLQFGGTNIFWQKRKGGALLESGFDLANGTSTVLNSYDTFSSTLGPVAMDFSRNLLAGINFTTSANVPDTLDLYDVSNPANPVPLQKLNFPTNHQGNANFIGQIVFAADRIFAINGNNGILALDINPPYRPSLNARVSTTNITLNWPTQAVGFVLQSANGLSNSPAAWTNISQTPSINNGQNILSEPLSDTVRYYRLRRP